MGPLPIAGFVLAGGRSSRMGTDKAALKFRGRPLIEIAVEKLAGFCAAVAISGNRPEFAELAPVVTETRTDVGPGAGIEAGLSAARLDWALFLPVDVPLLPAELLRCWAEAVLGSGARVSYLVANGQRQPSICLLRRECLAAISAGLDRGDRALALLFRGVEDEFGAGALHMIDAAEFTDRPAELDRWFANLNTPEDLAAAANS